MSWVRELVRGRAGLVLGVMVAITAVLGAFASQSVVEDGVAVENEYSAALDRIDEVFGDPSTVMQVVIESEAGGDIRSVDALTASLDIQSAVRDADVADTLLERGAQPPMVSFLSPAEQAIAEQGVDPADLDDEDVRQFQADARDQMPPERSQLVDDLIAEGDPPSAGLLLVFQDTADLDEDGVLEQQQALAEVIDAVEVPAGLEVSPLSLQLLLDNDEVGSEVGRLFGTALLIILAVLAVVYWLPLGAGRQLAAIRRTLADVGLTLLVVLFSVVWMQGMGVLLGPDFAGLIGYFDSQTQIVPILVVALGVDFAIHLLARYRSETGEARDPGRGFARAFGTVGVALLLDTAATAIGFLTNLFSPVDFLATLGVLAASGIVAAFALTMTFLPAARILLDRRALRRRRLPEQPLAASGQSALPRLMERTAWLAEKAPVATLIVAAVLTGVGVYGFTQLDSRFALTDFVPQDDPQLATFQTLQDEFGGGFGQSTEVLLTGDVATPEALTGLFDALEAAADVEGVETLEDEADATSVVSVLEQAEGDDGLAAQIEQLGVDPDGEVADDADVAGLYALLLDEVPTAQEVLARDGGEWISRVELRTTVDQSEALALRDGLLEAFAPLDDAGVSAFPTSQELVQASVSEQIEDAQLVSMLIALAAVMVLLAGYFGVQRRQPLVGVLTVLPVGFVLALTFGLMAVTGIPLNPVTATLAALSIGIGVPFTIHVAARFLEERDETEDRNAALRRALGQTGGAVIASALTTAIGFGVLTTSTLLPFEQLGYVIVYAIALSGVAATLILPSLLVLWDRR